MPAFWPRRLYRGWGIVFTGYVAQLATVGASGWVFGVLILPMQDDLGWSRSAIVGVVTVARLLNGIVAARLGPMVDRHGARLLMTLSAIGAGLCMVGTSLSQAQWQYYACWAGFGLCMPALSTVGPAVAIANWFIRKRSQAVMFYTLGSATAGLLLAPIVTVVVTEFGWRQGWLCLGAVFFVVGPLAWHFIRHRPEDLGLRPDGDDDIADSSTITAISTPLAEEPSWTVRQALHSRAFWLLTLGFMLTSFPAASIFIHMPSFVESKGFSAGEGAVALSFYGIGVLIGRFAWGIVVGRFGIHRSLVAHGLGYGLSILLFVAPHNLPAIYATTILLGISIAGSQQMHVQSYPEYFGRRIVGTLLGYAGVASALTGAAAPLLAAFAYDQSESYAATFSTFGVLCLVAGALFLFSKPKQPEATPALTLSAR